MDSLKNVTIETDIKLVLEIPKRTCLVSLRRIYMDMDRGLVAVQYCCP